MKKFNLLVIVCLFLNIIMKAQTNNLIPNQLRVQTHIQLDDKIQSSSNFLLFLEIRNIQKDSLNAFIMKQLLTDKIKVYSAFDNNLYDLQKNELVINELTERMGGGNDTLLIEENGILTQKVINNDINIEEVKSLLFVDSWFFNAEKMSFNKEVTAYYPIRWYYKPDDIDKENILLKKLCKLDFENMSKKDITKSNKRLFHFLSIKYEQLIDNEEEYFDSNTKNIRYDFALENKNAPYFTSLSKQFLAESILNKAINNEVQVIDFQTQKPISAPEVIQRMGAQTDTIMVVDENGNQKRVTVIGKVNSSEIRSYIFTEDWFLDPLTLRIVKKIRAIAPVRFYYKEDDVEQENVLKIIIFDLKLSN